MYKMPITLDMSKNKLKKLTPPKMKTPIIHHLDVSHNQVSRVPPNFNNLQAMTRLDLSNNQLEEISEYLGLTKYIRWLDLSHNQLVELPDHFCALGYALDELHVTHNRLTTLPPSIDALKVTLTVKLLIQAWSHRSRVSPPQAAGVHLVPVVAEVGPIGVLFRQNET